MADGPPADRKGRGVGGAGGSIRELRFNSPADCIRAQDNDADHIRDQRRPYGAAERASDCCLCRYCFAEDE